MLESSPPDKNVPTGTSLTSCLLIASVTKNLVFSIKKEFVEDLFDVIYYKDYDKDD